MEDDRDEFTELRLADKNARKWAQGFNKLLAKHERLLAALDAVANIAGNLPDERLENATGPNDARLRGGMVVSARNIARAAITTDTGD